MADSTSEVTMAGGVAGPMDTAPHGEEKPLLLFCPEQGGWHIGVWHDGRWVDFASLSVPLEPMRWQELPPNPIEP